MKRVHELYYFTCQWERELIVHCTPSFVYCFEVINFRFTSLKLTLLLAFTVDLTVLVSPPHTL